MSGIVGIVNLDGAPVNRELLWRMTRYLSARGPDAQEIWIDGNVGFGHTMLRTTFEAENERQPLTLDDHVWITADCRVDARADLIRELSGHGYVAREDAPDPELILHAYAVWGDQCVKHLLGDFSFAIWDKRRRALFCARDHFGVKPFLYAHVGSTLIFSNTLYSVRIHPAVSTRLDELAIADFLMVGIPQELDACSFADIRRLPPAHALTAGANPPRVARYWNLPEEEPIRDRRYGEHVEGFLELLDLAVRDRLRTNRVGVLMSGGLDSPAVAATAHRILSAAGSPFDLRAHNYFYERLVPDEEGKYSRIAAEGIGIPIHHYPLDDYKFLPEKPNLEGCPPEPIMELNVENAVEMDRGLVTASRVLLTGYGADPLIDLPGFALEPLFQKRQYGRLLRGFLWLMWTRRQIPRFGIRSRLRRRFSPPVAAPDPLQSYPGWLRPELAQRFDLTARWRDLSTAPDPATANVPCELVGSFWPYFLEYCDPGMLGLGGELRHPFLDLRLARYVRRLPPFPWFTEKNLLRVAMKGVLPKQILHRPKTPLVGNPLALFLPPARTAWWEPYLLPGFGLENFVDIGGLKAALEGAVAASQAVNDHADIDILRLSLRPIGLGFWLKLKYNGYSQEEAHERRDKVPDERSLQHSPAHHLR